MSSFRYLSSKDASAVEELLSQARDLCVLEQVAAINLAGVTDSALPTNLETRFRRLKSLPVSRQPDPVSSSKKLLSHSKSMAENRNFSGRIRPVPSVQSRPLVSSADQTRVFSGRINRDPSGNIGSRSCRLSRDAKVLSRPTTTTTQTLELLAKEKSRTSAASSASTDLVVSPSSTESDQEDRSNRKPKSKSSVSWFDRLLPSRATGCLFFSKHNVIKQQKKTQPRAASNSIIRRLLKNDNQTR
ncbi:hypothetical protein Bca4012_062418 [Brassica carinata]|uniref:Uncharacterized protein n=1 Tax=Brassica carinata TaxID=52824 RepID=A0A8X7SAU8_BRACI|nr:hypothetical protein Bca52824_032315 [Brassica carinata]